MGCSDSAGVDLSVVIADGWDAAPAPQAQQQFAAGGGDNFGAQY